MVISTETTPGSVSVASQRHITRRLLIKVWTVAIYIFASDYMRLLPFVTDNDSCSVFVCLLVFQICDILL